MEVLRARGPTLLFRSVTGGDHQRASTAAVPGPVAPTTEADAVAVRPSKAGWYVVCSMSPPVTADQARAIAARHVVEQFGPRAWEAAGVEMGTCPLYGLPNKPVWLVFPRTPATRVG